MDAGMKSLWSTRMERAIRWASSGHAGQSRKGTKNPYIEHPMAVAMILDRAGFDEDVVIAGLLHDLVEDTEATIEAVRERFGDLVALTVADCSEVKDDAQGRRRPWADRKRDHLLALREAPVTTRAVILADKLHNLACIALDLDDGCNVWATFNAGRDQVLDYYRASLAVCGSGDPRLEGLARLAGDLLDEVEARGESTLPKKSPERVTNGLIDERGGL